jgi:uncharacterized protein YndB with AHSA1/START domain
VKSVDEMELEMARVFPTAPTAVYMAFADPDDVEMLATLSFRDLGEATEVALAQGPFRTEARRALHHDGWSDSFDKLERHLSGKR